MQRSGTCEICDARTPREQPLCYVHEPWRHSSPGAKALARDAIYVQAVADERLRKLAKRMIRDMDPRSNEEIAVEEWL